MILSQHDIEELSALASKAAIEAGRIVEKMINNYERLVDKACNMSKASQVLTMADIKAQETIARILKSSINQFDLGWLGEESVDDHSRFEKDYFWCVDPLDGTLPYTEGYPGYAVSIALVKRNGEPVFGIVYLPYNNRLISSIKLPVINKSESEILNLYFDRSFLVNHYFDWIYGQLERYAHNIGLSGVKLHAKAGAVVNAIGVTENKAACYFKFPKKEKGGGSIWDYAATAAIVRATGGWVSNSGGGMLNLNSEQSTYMNCQGVLFASNKSLAEFIMHLYQKISKEYK